MRTKLYLILLLAVCAVGGLKAQGRKVPFRSRAQMDSLLNPPLMKNAEAVLRFDSVVRHVGTLTEDDDPVTCRFVCTNVSGSPVELVRVRTTCGCMVSEFQPGVIAPGEKREILLTYHPKNHPGTVDSNAFVYLSGSENAPVARLTLIGNVLPGADEWARFPFFMGKLRLKRKSVEVVFGSAEKSVERILCGNSGEVPLRLSALMIPKYAKFRTEPEVIYPGSEGDIVITVEKALVPRTKGKTFTFLVVVDGVEGKPSDRTITVKINVPNNNEK